jgi:hypothetical protein
VEGSVVIRAVKLDVLMPKACEILAKKMRPMHYRQLAEESVASLYPGEEASIGDIAEDLRGKGKRFPGEHYGMRYTGGAAGSYVLMSHWLCNEQVLFQKEKHAVRLSLQQCVDASIETAMRMPHMQNKFASSDITKAARIAKGMIVEQHVKLWFAQNWPMSVIDPDNKNDWTKGCDHDFKLEIPKEKPLLVDVAGLRHDGTFGCAVGKPKTDIHVLAELDFERNEVIIDGFVSKKNFTDKVPMHKHLPVSAMVFWCNCQLQGISFDSMRLSKYSPRQTKKAFHGSERLDGRRLD